MWSFYEVISWNISMCSSCVSDPAYKPRRLAKHTVALPLNVTPDKKMQWSRVQKWEIQIRPWKKETLSEADFLSLRVFMLTLY